MTCTHTDTHVIFDDGQTLTKVTFRNRGKAHRGLMWPATETRRGYLTASCECPGSRNGRLTNGAFVVCEGWTKSNCEG